MDSSQFSTSCPNEQLNDMIDDPPRRPLLVAMAVSAVAMLLYAASMTNLLTQDSMTYAVTALRGSFADLLHPHHMIYDVLLAGVLAVTGADRPGEGTLHALQAFNVLVSAIAIGVMFRLLLSLGLSTARSVLLSSVLALSNGFWMYSSQIEVYNLASLSCMITLLMYLWRDRGRWAEWSGACAIVLAMLSHQTAVFFAIGLLVQLLARHSGAERRRLVATFIVAPGIFVAGLYMWAAWFVTGHLGPRGIWLFATSYAHTGQWGSVSSKSFLKAPYGFVSAFVQIDGLRPGYLPIASIAGLLLLFAAVIAAVVAVVAIMRRRGTVTQRRDLRPLLFTWLLTHALFVLWWHPSNIEFWILVVPIVVLLIAIAEPGERKEKSRWAFAAAPLLLVAAQLAMNVGGVVEGTSAVSERDTLARGVASLVGDEDLVVVASHPAHVPYIRFYSGATVSFPFPVVEPGTSDTATIRESTEQLTDEARRALSRGGQILIVGNPLLIPGSTQPRSSDEQLLINRWLERFKWQRLGSYGVEMRRTSRD